jgi:hypothetical protein
MADTTANAIRIAGALLLLAVVLAIIGLVVRVVRWLVVVAAVLLLAAAAVRWLLGRDGGAGGPG